MVDGGGREMTKFGSWVTAGTSLRLTVVARFGARDGGWKRRLQRRWFIMGRDLGEKNQGRR